MGEFGVLDWHKLQILSELGYSIAKTHVDGWFEDWKSRKVREAASTLKSLIFFFLINGSIWGSLNFYYATKGTLAAHLTDSLLTSNHPQHIEGEAKTPSYSSPHKLRFNSLSDFSEEETSAGAPKEWLKLLKEQASDGQRDHRVAKRQSMSREGQKTGVFDN